jgi:hypothetical protein
MFNEVPFFTKVLVCLAVTVMAFMVILRILDPDFTKSAEMLARLKEKA